jgi:hypothetical protein
MACINQHSSTVQGPGLCCTAVSNGQLVLPPGTTRLPPYTQGYNLATNPANFPHVMVQTSTGKCGTCMIVGSSSLKHSGRPVLKFRPGGPGCPTTSRGCCALTTV